MNWSRVKTILIILFLLIDLLLVGGILWSAAPQNPVSLQEVADVVNILKRNGLQISDKIIPRATEELGVVELDNVWPDRELCASILFGGNRLSQLAPGSYGDAGKQVTFGSNYFTYTNSSVTCNNPEEAAAYLGEMGISVLPADIYDQNGKWVSQQKIDDKTIFETALEIPQEAGSFTCSGYWLLSNKEVNLNKKPAASLQPITSVLVEFTANPYYNREGDTILSITTGYSLGTVYRDTTHKLVSVVPAYKIALQSGEYYIYDALSGEFSYGLKNGNVIY